MGMRDVTGWHYSGYRQSLNQPIKAGNGKLGSFNIFPGPRTSVTNNYYGCYDNHNGRYHSSSTGWVAGLFGAGMGLKFLGNLFSWIWPNKETPAEEPPKQVTPQDVNMYGQIAAKNGHNLIGPDSDGNYVLLDKDGKIAQKGNFETIKNYIETTFAKPSTNTTTVTGGSNPNATDDTAENAGNAGNAGGAGDPVVVSNSDGVRRSGYSSNEGSNVTVKAQYVYTMPSGNKCYLQVMSDGSYKYLDKNKTEIEAHDFKKQTGLTAEQAVGKYQAKKTKFNMIKKKAQASINNNDSVIVPDNLRVKRPLIS